ncbi:MAG: 2-hydroxyacyl-CoA dehydratase, partial [Thermoproteus sp.]|nr:2-hydroxyacyl-CoA dehydratase [Thermoproteus sp.]
LYTDYIKNAVWIGQIDASGDPLDALVRAYVTNPIPLTTRYHPAVNKQRFLGKWVKEMGANAVLFFTPKFCEPSIYDHLIYKAAAEEAGVPYVRVDYEEGMTSFEQPRTTIESI